MEKAPAPPPGPLLQSWPPSDASEFPRVGVGLKGSNLGEGIENLSGIPICSKHTSCI